MAIFRNKLNSPDGFTLLEVVAVLVIVGILSAIVLNRWTSFDAEVYSGASALKTHLRYAQAQAMNKDPNVGQNTIMGIKYDSSSNQYWLFQGVTTTDIQFLPDDMKYLTSTRTIDLNLKKIKLNAGFVIYFDDRGIPYDSYTDATNNSPLSALKIIVVSATDGSQTVSININPQTGYIP